MEKLKIKYFGPIKTGTSKFITFKKTTIFIGEQGSGKSTIVKVFSSLTWLEKSMLRNENNKITIKDIQLVFAQQNLPKSYFNDKTQIIYEGLYYRFSIEKSKFKCEKLFPLFDNYICPKIIYIPSERNILSVIDNLHKVEKLPEMLRELMYLQEEAKKSIVEISFNNFRVKFNKDSNDTYVYANKSSSELKIEHASSGLQSIVPIIYVLKYLRAELNKHLLVKIKNLNSEYRNKILEKIKNSSIVNKLNDFFVSNVNKGISKSDLEIIERNSRHFINNRLVSIIEEPEQNLFPLSQVEILKGILKFSNGINDKIILTTHSPYILSEINNLIYAYDIYEKTNKKINSITNDMIIKSSDIEAYRIKNGRVYSIFDNNNSIIDVSEIDDCSINISEEYDSLIELGNYDRINKKV